MRGLSVSVMNIGSPFAKDSPQRHRDTEGASPATQDFTRNLLHVTLSRVDGEGSETTQTVILRASPKKHEFGSLRSFAVCAAQDDVKTKDSSCRAKKFEGSSTEGDGGNWWENAR